MPETGRFAPSPSGRMHLGNIYAALLSYLSAKKTGASWVLRIEDLDRERCKKEYTENLLKDLEWLGFEWDDFLLQSQRDEAYREAYESLCKKAKVYECFCSRADLLSSTAPHEKAPPYSGKCKNLSDSEKNELRKRKAPSYRLEADSRIIHFTDGHYGEKTFSLREDCGDFVIRRANKSFSYQLAVVVDDAKMGVTQVVRGRDLLPSTPEQLYLYSLLDLTPPSFFHIPLLLSADGRRLSKRDRDCDMEYYRSHTSPEALIGYIMHLCSFTKENVPLSLKEALTLFSWEKLPKEDITLNLK